VNKRYTISVLEQNFSKSEIAIVIKDKSVLTRELQRNCDLRSGKYDFDLSENMKKRQKAKPKEI
jgi:IS30 family transposase